ncbi:two-component sensor histidine kinase [Pseudomonas cichorii]|nr:two-component sensor histidine kinase [Pseudomonas cichorii]
MAAIVLIALSMWTHFLLSEWETQQRMPVETRLELEQLRSDPRRNEARLWQISAQYYDIEDVVPGISNKDWFLLAFLVAAALPVILLCGLLFSRPLSSQFSAIAKVARSVAQGDFNTRLPVTHKGPEELQRLVSDFNSMTTQLHRYEQEVRESSAVIAHELRTPLNASMGRVQGMIDCVFPRDAEQLNMVKRQLDQLSKLVDDLHLLSLARAGQLQLDKTRFALDKLIDERLTWFSDSLANAGIQPTVDIAPDLHIEADRDRMGQVVNILIDNVLRYAAQGRELHIYAIGNKDKVSVAFADRGPGFEEKDLDLVFNRFWRAERSRARYSGGSGLGLSIARAICLEHDASISAENRDGGGSVITAELPQAQR